MATSRLQSIRGASGRGRRPAAEVRAEILAAAGEILLNEGLAHFTVQRVAERSGASRMTIHKWWASRGALAFDAYRVAVDQTLAFPDTGDVEQDIRSQLRSFVQLITETQAGRVIAELMGLAQTDPELRAALIEHYTTPRRNLGAERLRRGQAQGKLRPEVDPEVVIDQLWGACYHRLLNPAVPLTVAFADSLVANLWQGIAEQPAP